MPTLPSAHLVRRRIAPWALAYLAGAWVVYEVLTQVGEVFAWPVVILRALTVVLLLGFCITVVLAWYHGEEKRGRFTPGEFVILSVLLVVGAVGVGMVSAPPDANRRTGSALPEPSSASDSRSFEASVAVLPFDNISGDPANDHVAAGLTEEVISQLAQIGAIKVISRTSVEALKGSDLTLPQIADTLGVIHVLEGSLRSGSGGLRISAQLVDARSDSHVWADRYDRGMVDPVDAQQEIARLVIAALLPHVTPPVPTRPRTGHREAYGTFLTGRALLHERTAEGVRSAIETFREVIAMDSLYAPAYAGLAAAYALGIGYGYMEGEAYRAAGQALARADRAIQLDSTLAEAYAVRAYVLNKLHGPGSPIHSDLNRALQYQPNSADVHGWRAHWLARENRYGEAFVAAQRAVDLDPIAPGRRYGFAIDALAGGRYDLALEQARQALVLVPDLVPPRAAAALALVLMQRPSDCLSMAPDSWPGVRAICLVEAGGTTEAARLIAEAERNYVSGPRMLSVAASIACYYGWIGRAEDALRWARESFDRSPYGLDYRLLATPIFDRVRNQSDFRDGVARLKREVYDRVTLGTRPLARGDAR